METKEKVSFIHSIAAKIMLMVVVMVALSLMACISIANVRASATVSNVNEKFILSLTGISGKNIGQDSGRGRFFHPVCSCHAGYEHGGCTVCLWISCRF